MICEDKKTNDNWKKNYNFTLNINYLLYTSKSICFSHTFVYYRSILYSMLLTFFKVESAVAFNSCMIEFSIPGYNTKIIKNIFKYWTL